MDSGSGFISEFRTRRMGKGMKFTFHFFHPIGLGPLILERIQQDLPSISVPGIELHGHPQDQKPITHNVNHSIWI